MNGMIHGRQSPVPAWNRWEAALESSCDRADPYAGVTVSVSYRGPGGRVVHGTAFWDGGRTYRIRCMFPEPGEWAWETRCSDPADEGLHGRRGVVLVSRYEGDNPLYRRGYLRVSESGRYLQHDDGTPFLWVGDTSWLAYVRAVQPEWERYVDDRVAKGFTVLVVSCTCSGGPSDQTDAEGNSPFIGDGATRWNPAFWSNFDKKVGYANDRGAVVVVTGVAWGERMHLASLEEVRAFARNLSARLAFNFVILSPLQDWAEGSDEGIHLAGEEIHRATPYQLVTQHPKRRPMPELVLGYHTQPYIDFTSVQTGIGPDMDGVPIELPKASRCTVEWLTALYNAPPTRPIINLEGAYEDDYNYFDVSGQMLVMARRGGYLSFLCGAYGFTSSTFAIWAWGRPIDFGRRDDAPNLQSGMERPYATYLGHLARFFSAIDWWRLEPRHALVANQAKKWHRKMLFAKNPEGDLGVAFLPDNRQIVLDLSGMQGPLRATWFDPLAGVYRDGPPSVPASGRQVFERPAAWQEAVLLLASD